MKHAYLIIAHHEFEILERLVKALDDERNDIYIHFDKKVERLPLITTDQATLYVLENRVDVRWGDISQIASEIALFEKAVHQGPYLYYHILSGVDLPIRSQDFIHDFFTLHGGKEFIGFYQGDDCYELDTKVRRYHLFSRHFRSSGSVADYFRKAVRSMCLRLQLASGIRRHAQTVFRKGSNWVSVTHGFACYLLREKEQIMAMYKHSFCADEIFLQTLCWNSTFRHRLFNSADDALGCMRRINWKEHRVEDWTSADLDDLMGSNAVFARKFSSKHPEVIDEVFTKVRRDV